VSHRLSFGHPRAVTGAILSERDADLPRVRASGDDGAWHTTSEGR
jgi:hypothetical protein